MVEPRLESKGFWIEEMVRGGEEHLLVLHNADARGTIRVDTYEEKAAWIEAVKLVNSILVK